MQEYFCGEWIVNGRTVRIVKQGKGLRAPHVVTVNGQRIGDTFTTVRRAKAAGFAHAVHSTAIPAVTGYPPNVERIDTRRETRMR